VDHLASVSYGRLLGHVQVAAQVHPWRNGLEGFREAALASVRVPRGSIRETHRAAVGESFDFPSRFSPAGQKPDRNHGRFRPLCMGSACLIRRTPMPMQPTRRLTCVLALLVVPFFPVSLAAQTAPAVEPQPSLFRQVIPQPSGKNGYELLVLAA